MIDVALLSASQRRFFPPPATRRSRKPMPAQDRQSFSNRRACVRRSRILRKKARRLRSRREYARRQPPKAHERFVRDINPIGRARPTSAPNLPAVSSLGGFRTRAPQPA